MLLNFRTRSIFSSPFLKNGKKDVATFDEDFLAEIERKIARNRQILRRHSLSHIKWVYAYFFLGVLVGLQRFAQSECFVSEHVSSAHPSPILTSQ